MQWVGRLGQQSCLSDRRSRERDLVSSSLDALFTVHLSILLSCFAPSSRRMMLRTYLPMIEHGFSRQVRSAELGAGTFPSRHMRDMVGQYTPQLRSTGINLP